MHLFNGSNIFLKDIPVYSEPEFRGLVIAACQNGGRLLNFFGQALAADLIRLLAIVGYDDEGKIVPYATTLSGSPASYECLTKDWFAAHLFEREIAEQWAVVPREHPWLKPLRYHENYRGVPDVWPQVMAKTIPGMYPFYKVEGEEVHEVGVGPVHAGIIEPGHFRFQCHGEQVLHLEIQLGYQHRGVESLMTSGDLRRCALLSESIAGDTVVGHSTAFCEVVESLSGCLIPARAQAIRAVGLELERVANHVGDLAALSADVGFLPPAAFFGRMRGDYLNLLLTLMGNRFGKGLCRPGGVLFDIPNDMAAELIRELKVCQKEFEDVSELLFTRPSVLARFEELGVISSESAFKYGLVGPAGRASQLARDIRTDYASGIWQFYHIPVSLAATGDVYGRALVRRQEVLRSLDFLIRILSALPEGMIFVQPGPMKKDAMALSLVEGWRGELMHIAITDWKGDWARYKIKDPSFHNWTALAMSMRGEEISDFPLCNKSFNLSYAGHDL
ncbi:MAG: hydrogenase [Candidatus Omnitrophica bacterium]|nr:hydrogenase [Candidatus Omnitrophota bacterium]